MNDKEFNEISDSQKEWIAETKEWIIEHIKERRRFYNIPQREYADLLRIDLEKYTRLERHPSNFSMDYILYVALWVGLWPNIELQPYNDEEN